MTLGEWWSMRAMSWGITSSHTSARTCSTTRNNNNNRADTHGRAWCDRAFEIKKKQRKRDYLSDPSSNDGVHRRVVTIREPKSEQAECVLLG